MNHKTTPIVTITLMMTLIISYFSLSTNSTIQEATNIVVNQRVRKSAQYKRLSNTTITNTLPTQPRPDFALTGEGCPNCLGADLTLTNNDGETLTTESSILIYTLTYNNQGADLATGVFISETVPTHAAFAANFSTAGWQQVGNTNTFTYSVGTLTVGQSGNVQFAIILNDTLPETVGTITNTAYINDDRQHGPDKVPHNNTATDLTFVTHEPTEICGTLIGDATLIPQESPYIVTCNLVIPPTVTLTINPGTQLKFNNQIGILVDGTLHIEGTETFQTTLTSNNSAPVNGFWDGIDLRAGGQATINNTLIEYGGSTSDNPDAIISLVAGATLTLTQSTIANSATVGTLSQNGKVTLQNNQFRDIVGVGALIQADATTPTPILTDNIFENGTNYAATLTLNNNTAVIHGNSGYNNNRNGIEIEGTLANNTRLGFNNDTFPYIIDDLTVAVSTTLTLDPRVIVKFNDANSDITVNGNIVAQGTATSPIIFTELRDDTVGGDTNNNATVTTPFKGAWDSINILNGATALFDHTIIRYGGDVTGNTTARALLFVEQGGILTTTNTTLEESEFYGLHSNNGQLTFDNNTLNNSGNVGLLIQVDATAPIPILTNNIINNSNSYAATFTLNNNAAVIHGNSGHNNAFNAIKIQGTLVGDTNLGFNNDTFPYIIDDLTVAVSTTLTIDPGVIIKFNDVNSDIAVNGNIVAQGTPLAPIIFTELRDDTVGGDTNNNGAASAPFKGAWDSINILNGATGLFDHTIIRYGGDVTGNTARALLFVGQGGILTATNSTLEESEFYGVHSNNGQLTLQDNTIDESNNVGIFIQVNAGTVPPFLANNVINNSNNYAASITLNNNTTAHISGNSGTNNNFNAIELQGSLSGDTIWADNELPYIIDTLTVASGSRLTIDPGVIIKFNDIASNLSIDGTLLAQGVASNGIVFTALQDDTYGGDTTNNGTITLLPGAWRSINIRDGGAATFDHAIIQYGGDSSGAFDALLHIASNGTVTLTNSLLSNSEVHALFSDSDLPLAPMSNNQFVNNNNHGLINTGSTTIDARNSWWGDASGPFHHTLNPTGLGNRVSNNLLFDPWLTTPPPLPPVTINFTNKTTTGTAAKLRQLANYGVHRAIWPTQPLLILASIPPTVTNPYVVPKPSSFYGFVTNGGVDVPTGTPITALINDVPIATTITFLEDGRSVYRLDVLGDIAATPENEGGIEGQRITFQIGATTASQTAVWQNGTYIRLDLDRFLGVDLALTKDDGRNSLLPGETTTYHLTITNNGLSTATAVFLNDSLPISTTFVTASDNGTLMGDHVIWPPFSLAAGNVTTRSLTLQLADPLPLTVTTITNTATVTDTADPLADPTPFNNIANDSNTLLTVRANPGGPYSGAEGAPILLDGAASTDRDGTILLYEWDLDNDGAFDDAVGITTTVTFPDNDTFTVSLRVTDNSSESNEATTTVTTTNISPTVTITTGQLATEGTPFTQPFATFTDPGTADTHTATVNWGDGSPTENATLIQDAGSGTLTGTHTYLDDGTYAVTLCVTDDDSATHCQTTPLTVTNATPKVEAGPDAIAAPGQTITLAPATFTDLGLLDVHTATIDWGDGTVTPGLVTESNGNGTINATHTYTVSGIFTAEVCVTDNGGATGCDRFFVNAIDLQVSKSDGTTAVSPDTSLTYTIAITNASPVTITGILVTDTLPAYTTFITASDNGAYITATHTVVWAIPALNNNATTQRFVTVQLNATLPSTVTTMTNTVTAIEDGSQGPDPRLDNNTNADVNTITTVQANAGGPYSGLEGEAITIDGSDSIDRNGIIVLYEWDFDNDGQFDDAVGISGTLIIGTDGLYPIALRVTDNSGETDTDFTTATITNPPIFIEAGPNRLATEGDVILLNTAVFTDPGNIGLHTATVDWGDGTILTGTISETNGIGTISSLHAYLDNDTYTVEVCVTNNESTIGCDTLQLTITNSLPFILSTQATDLQRWTPTDHLSCYDGQGHWDNTSQIVTQTQNSQPTLFYGDINPFDNQTSFHMRVLTNAISTDDDFIGFVLGYDPHTPTAEHLLIDWKGGSLPQSNAFGCGGITTAQPGLALSRVKGNPADSERWGHLDYSCNGNENRVTEVARATNLGQTGWLAGTNYEIEVQLTAVRLQLFVNGVLELDIVDDFTAYANGRLGFYAYSQPLVQFDQINTQTTTISEGSTITLTIDFTDNGILDTHTATVDWGDGTITTGNLTQGSGIGQATSSHTYLEGDATYSIDFCITDNDGGSSCAPFTAHVFNVAPTVVAGPDQTAVAGQPISFTAPFTDPGLLDNHFIEIDWGDGTIESQIITGTNGSGIITGNHTYLATQAFRVELCVTDSGLGAITTCESFRVNDFDLSLSKDNGRLLIAPGSQTTYSLTIQNDSNVLATGILLTDTLPAHTTFITATNGGVYNSGNNTVLWHIPPLPSGQSSQRTLTIELAATLPLGLNTLINTAVVSGNGPDVTPANNIASDTTQISTAPIANFSPANGLNVIRLVDGASITEFSSVISAATTAQPENAIDDNPNTCWQTGSGQNSNQIVKVAPTGNGAPHIVDQIVLRGSNSTFGARTFALAISDTGTTDLNFTTILTGTIPQDTNLHTFTFDPTRLRQARLTLLDNHGGSFIQLCHFELNTRLRQGGIISLKEGPSARVVDFSSQSGISFTPDKLLDEGANTAWRSATGQTTDQFVTVELGGGLLYTVDRIQLQPRAATEAVRDFEIRVSSTTTETAAFTTVLSSTASNSVSLQEFTFAPTPARYVQLFVKDGHGTTCCIGVSIFKVLTADGLNTANGNDVGAIITELSTQSSVNSGPDKAIDFNANTAWTTANGAVTGQWFKLRPREGGPYLIDRIKLNGGNGATSPRRFQIRVSNNTLDDADFIPVFAATLPSDGVDHWYTFPPVLAKYVQLFILDNYGSTNSIVVKDFQLFTSLLGETAVPFDNLSTSSSSTIVASHWDFGDGTTSTLHHPLHTYSAAGTYTISLTITDSLGFQHTVVKPYTALAPVPLDFTVMPPLPNEGQNTTLTDVSPVGNQYDIVARFWQFSHTTSQPTNTSTNITFPDNGTFTVTLNATDHQLLSASLAQTVAVSNVPPTIEAGTDQTIFTNETWQAANLSLSDAGTVDRSSLTCDWNFGDGQSEQLLNCNSATARVGHVYTTPGLYTAAITVTDKDGAAVQDSTLVTVTKRASTLSIYQVEPISTTETAVSILLFDSSFDIPLPNQVVTLSWQSQSMTVTTDLFGQAVAILPLPAGETVAITANYGGDEDYESAQLTVTVTIGSEQIQFWLAFPSNFTNTGDPSLFMSSEVNTSGIIQIPGLAFTMPFAIESGIVTTIDLPRDVFIQATTTTEEKGIFVTAINEIKVYGLSRLQFTTDAYLGLPIEVLGTEYIVMAFGGRPGSQFNVVGTEDNTTVAITPTIGTPHTITVNQGEVYQAHTTSGDFTGSQIVANAPIAVYGGHNCANVPNSVTFCDHIIEQLIPTSKWGQNFATMPLATRQNGDTFRLLASQNNTQVTINGLVVATLNKGEFHTEVIDGPAHITANAPILVAQYSNGTSFDGVTSDPFMLLVPPFEQFLGNYPGVLTPASGFRTNFVNVVAPAAAVGSIILDGAIISPSRFVPIGSSGFSGAQVELEAGSHALNGPLPFGISMYGFDDFDSYGYPGGLAFGDVALATTLTLAPATATQTVGQSHCVTATVNDQDSNSLSGIRVDFATGNVHQRTGFDLTDGDGDARFCYLGTIAGTDTITATVGTLSDTASVTWASLPVSNPPIATADFAATTLNTAVTVTVLANDSDPDSDPITVTTITQPVSGTAVLNIDGTVTYTPALDITGTDSFSYTITDGNGNNVTALVTIFVLPNAIKINFQRPESSTPLGYLGDSGFPYGNRGNGYTYGWISPTTGLPTSNVENARDRDWNQTPDQRYDTFNHMRRYGDYTWEMEIANGWYLVHAVVGDPEFITGTYRLDIEGVLTVAGDPLVQQHWLAGQSIVEVTDGRLTVSNNANADRNKLAFIEVTPLPFGPTGFQVDVNFQPATTPVPTGYVPDSGHIYADRGNGFSYGWNSNATVGIRERTLFTSLDSRYNTLNHMQAFGNFSWEIAVPNGLYAVFISNGDPQYFIDHVYQTDVEGVTAVDGQGRTTNRLRSVGTTIIVAVTDGRLTLSNAVGASRNKIQFIEITQIGG